MKKIKPLKRKRFRNWLKQTFEIHNAYDKRMNAPKIIDEWNEMGVTILTKRRFAAVASSKKTERVWIGLDLSEGKDYTIKVTLGKDGKSAEYVIIDETFSEEEKK